MTAARSNPWATAIAFVRANLAYTLWGPVNVCTYAFPLPLQIQLVGLAGFFGCWRAYRPEKSLDFELKF